MTVQWGLAGGNNALANFQFGAQMGQGLVDRREEREQRNAMLELRRQQEERMGRQDERQWAIWERQDQQQRRADLPIMEKLLSFAQDEGTYQQARQVAQQYGVDVSQLPPSFDPAWRDQQLATVKLLNTPQGQEALSAAGKVAADMGLRPGTPEFNAKVTEIFAAEQQKTISYQPGGGVVGYNPMTGQTTPIVQPGPSVPAAVPYNPSEWEVIGGPGGSPSGAGFQR